jgi:hypothetical protein
LQEQGGSEEERGSAAEELLWDGRGLWGREVEKIGESEGIREMVRISDEGIGEIEGIGEMKGVRETETVAKVVMERVEDESWVSDTVDVNSDW